MKNLSLDYMGAVKAIKKAIQQSRYYAARLANAELLKLYFQIGGYVSVNTRHGKWGTGAIEAISHALQQEMPGLRGFSAANMKKMRIFYEEWCGLPIRSLLTNELKESSAGPTNRSLAMNDLSADGTADFLAVGFTHHMEIIFKCKTREERKYYIRRCAGEFWSVDALRNHIDADDYKKAGNIPCNFARTIPDKMLAKAALRSFKDEYLLDFINVESDDPEYDERVFSKELIANIQKFMQSLGPEFCFVAKEQRIIFEEEESFVDLLFFHRKLRCLVALELKTGSFKPSQLGQLSYYLSLLDDKMKLPEENPSIGLVFCKKAKRAVVEMAVRDYSRPLGVVTYKTKKEIPQSYDDLKPVIEGVQKILAEEPEEGKE